MKRLWLFIPLAILMAVLGIIFALYHTLEYEHKSPMVGQHVPSLLLVGIDEGEIDLAEMTGRPYVLHVGASWCEGCQNEGSIIEDIRQTGTSVVGVFYKDSAQNVQAFFSGKPNPYDVVLMDPEGKALVNLGALTLPSTYVMNENGVIEEVISGPLVSSHQVIRNLP